MYRYLYFQRPCHVPLFKRMGYVNSMALSFSMKSILGRNASGLFIQHINTVFYMYFLARCVLLQCFCKAQWSSPDFVATATLPAAMDLRNTLHHSSFLALNLSIFVVVWHKCIKFACKLSLNFLSQFVIVWNDLYPGSVICFHPL